MRVHSLRSGRVHLALVLALGALAGCGEEDAPDDNISAIRPPEIARIVPANEAIAGAHIPTLDPATMVDAEILNVLGGDSRCEFRYTSAGGPVLAVSAPSNGDPADGVVKLNGHLVALRSASTDGALVLSADRIRLTITPDDGGQAGALGDARQREADLIFEVGDSLRVGYRGYYNCVD
jgi:hypothetical protein